MDFPQLVKERCYIQDLKNKCSVLHTFYLVWRIVSIYIGKSTSIGLYRRAVWSYVVFFTGGEGGIPFDSFGYAQDKFAQGKLLIPPINTKRESE